MNVAESEGFEPSVELLVLHSLSRRAPSALLGQLSTILIHMLLAEEVGFEPTVLAYNGFQDRRLKPLGHSSLKSVSYVPFQKRAVNGKRPAAPHLLCHRPGPHA